MKDGVGRFVRYISYPMWSKGGDMPDKLNLKTHPPENVLEDVTLFIEGKASFYELPRKQGRKRRVIRTLTGEGLEPGTNPVDESGRAVDAGQSVQPKRRARRSGHGVLSSPSKKDGTSGPIRWGRLSSTDLPKSSGGVGWTLKQLTSEVEASKVLPTPEPAKGVEEVVRKKRGRPRKVK